MQALAIAVTPLWPARHLPLKGGDPLEGRPRPSPSQTLGRMQFAGRCRESFSPLEGEMPGRAEGGGVPFVRRAYAH